MNAHDGSSPPLAGRPAAASQVIRYRLYTLDHAGHVIEAQDILCDTDIEALTQAEAYPRNRARELWRGGERLASLASRPAE